MKRYMNPKGTLIFIIIAVVLMVAADIFIRSPEYYDRAPLLNGSVFDEIGSEIKDFETAHTPENRLPPPRALEIKPQIKEPQKSEAVKEVPIVHVQPKVAIIIDDMGLSYNRAHTIMELKGPLTLAFLPYAKNLEKTTRAAKSYGHELMIHMPMEPMKESLDPGPNALRVSMNNKEINKALNTAFSSFHDYKGINNHMGSKLTQDKERMQLVMNALKKRNLYFIDSKTISGSVADDVAAQTGVRHAARDVFIDHVETYEFATNALKKTEEIALHRGYAIAIGHPKPNTVKALKEWLPTLKEKGIELVPASELVTHSQ